MVTNKRNTGCDYSRPRTRDDEIARRRLAMVPSNPWSLPACRGCHGCSALSAELRRVADDRAIPHYFVLAGLAIAAVFALIGGFFAVVFNGEYPAGIRGFLVGVYRYGLRVQAYVGLLTDQYPPFSIAA